MKKSTKPQFVRYDDKKILFHSNMGKSDDTMLQWMQQQQMEEAGV